MYGELAHLRYQAPFPTLDLQLEDCSSNICFSCAEQADVVDVPYISVDTSHRLVDWQKKHFCQEI
ncbi:MAG: hypothetical protein A3G76_15725 [Acidobacteria bacterium RIFCSPLOWO2_12_FULL_65_11]|nr:MAG: hypothetical protein A3H95_17300 [Acidobacteria bacterium RIFCSPLOWO2_02_FULL_64_15]OFW30710.1 MAG: hypothetical protein A3G76_15725 [Acidobacteria bacterium RIFCSPLOWO2_12_FULL_65_11]